ncbi:MAG: hypothetical protein ABR506_05810 [Candidatus Krumholzibacteriia bacterium]
MAPLPSSTAERGRDEGRLLERLLGLYAEEHEVYGRVLELSRQQGRIVRTGGHLAEVRRVLEQKKACLDLVARLELTERGSKAAWEQGRRSWSPAGQARLHAALCGVTALIEDILACEEENDLEMIARTQVV